MKQVTSASKFRLRAFALLILWLLAWTASAAQPCCEALASLIPHHANAGVPDGHQHGHHHNPKQANQDHQHCPQAKPLDLGAPIPVLGTIDYRPQLLAAVAAEPLPWATLIVQRTSASLLHYALPPPLSPPPFLTKRLLI